MTGKEFKKQIKSLGISITDAANILNRSRATLYAWFEKDSIDESDIMYIKSKISDYVSNMGNLGYDLQTKDESSPAFNELGVKYITNGLKPNQDTKQKIPLYSLSVEAGFEIGIENSPDYIEGYIQMPGIGTNEGSWIVSGHSMYPTISKGSRVVLRKLEDWGLIEWNNIYVVDIREIGPKVKRIRKSINKESFVLASDNKEYESMEIERKDIKSIHLVLLTLEMF